MSKKLSREEIANIEVGHTDISRPLSITMTAIFLAVIMAYPLFQAGYEIMKSGGNNPPQALEIGPRLYRVLRAEHGGDGVVKKLINTNSALLKAINSYEDELKQQSLLQRYFLSPSQGFMLSILKTGNEKAFIGQDGWLFYRSGVRYLTNGGFLQPDILRKRIAKDDTIQPDPIKAIVQFKRQLEERGIRLIVVPVPVKPMFYPEKLTGKMYEIPLDNPSFKKFARQLGEKGVLVFDPIAVLLSMKMEGEELFLKSDTHWTPQAMERVAESLSKFIRHHIDLSRVEKYKFHREARTVSGEGDIAVMLKVESIEQIIPPQQVDIKEVSVGTSYWHADRNSPVLLLGDSFSNIYSLAGMGWGEHAGLAEQLSFYLQFPIDTILRNDAGAYATRKLLSQALKRGDDRLAGKKVVVWEFARRELADGDWKMLDMKLETPKESTFVVPPTGHPIIVEGIVRDISAVPHPGAVPYKDHVMSIHLVSQDGSRHYLIYAMSMKDNKLLPPTKLRVGDKARFKLCNWEDVEEQYSGLNRSDIEDEDIALEDPCWGEIVPPIK